MIEKSSLQTGNQASSWSWADVLAIATLVALTVGLLWKMAFTDLILPRGDVFSYFYPYWQYRDAILRTGRLPLWNPYLFTGVPFLANSQVGVFYPLNWPLVWLDTPSAIKVAIVFHIAWAAIGMYLFSRRALSLSVLGSTLAASTLAFGGYLTAQVEHVNQLQGLAWLPWLFWLWYELIARKRRKALVWMALVMALQLLAGHSQSTFITGIGLGTWAAWHAISCNTLPPRANYPQPTRFSKALQSLVGVICTICALNPQAEKDLPLKLRLHIWPIGAIALGGLLALGLAAVQLVPTIELAGLSNRGGGLPFDEAVSFSLRPWLAGRALLPSYGPISLFSEYVAYIGITALLLALAGAWAGRKSRTVLGLVMLGGLGLLLALGAYNPIYWVLVKLVPGFNLFRAPARWMILWAFAGASLAGTGLDALVSRIDAASQVLRFTYVWRLALIVIGLAALAFAAAPLSADNVPGVTSPGTGELALWAFTLGAACLLVWWTLRNNQNPQQAGSFALVILAVLELFLASRSLPFNHLSAPAAWSSQRPAISTLLAAQQGQTPPARFISLSDITFDPGDLHEIEANYEPYLEADALYDLIVAIKQKEVLTPNLPMAWGIPAMDGYDGGVLPTRDYTRFTALFLDENDVAPDGRLRENLSAVPDLHWLRLANTGWIITDKMYDAWVDHIYYDLQFPARLTAGTASTTEAHPDQSFVATAVGIIGHLEGAVDMAASTQIADMTLYLEDAGAITMPLLAGSTQPDAIGAPDGSSTSAVGSFTPDQPDRVEYHTLVSLAAARPIEHVEVTVLPGFPGTLIVRGITLVDQRSAAFASTTLSKDHTLRLANSGDVKIYQDQGALPRAYLVCDIDVADGQEAMWQKMQLGSGTKTVIDDQEPRSSGSCDAPDPGQAIITTYEPEHVVIDILANQEAYLILSDAWYPGWEATIDAEPIEILRANGLFRAIWVTEGKHQVVFTYQSRMLTIGAVVSAVFLVLVAAGLIIHKLDFVPGQPYEQ